MIRRGRGINVNEIMYYNQDDMIRSKYKQEVCIDDRMLYSLILPYKERNELIKTRMIVAFCVSLSLILPSLSITILNALFNGIDDDFWFMIKFSLIAAFLIFAFISLILWRPKRWDERKIMKKKQKIQDKLDTIHIYKAKMIAPTTPTDVRLNLITEILIINRQDKEFSKVFDTVYINYMLEKGMDYVYVLELVTNKNQKIELVYLPFNFRNKSSFSTEDCYTMHMNAHKDVFDNIYDEFLQGQTQHKEREKINGQCLYCGSDIDSTTQICSTCGAINRNYKRH